MEGPRFTERHPRAARLLAGCYVLLVVVTFAVAATLAARHASGASSAIGPAGALPQPGVSTDVIGPVDATPTAVPTGSPAPKKTSEPHKARTTSSGSGSKAKSGSGSGSSSSTSTSSSSLPMTRPSGRFTPPFPTGSIPGGFRGPGGW